MPVITIFAGLALIVIGIGFFFGTEQRTALIPAAPGLLLLLGGAFAFKPNLRKHMIHAALVLALLTIVAVSYRLLSTIRPAHAAQLLSVLVCVIYIAIGIQSFLAARRRRLQDKDAGATPGSSSA